MANEKELDDKEVLKTPESPEKKPEITPEVLKQTAEVTIQKIDEKNTQDKEAVKHLADQAVQMSSTIEQIAPVKEEVQKKEKKIKALTEKTKIEIEQKTQEPSIEHLPNYLKNSEEAKLVEMVQASEKVQKRFDEKISEDMKEAIVLVCGKIFNKCSYPYALIGSNCYVPHTEHSEKITDDLDVIFGIKDLDFVFDELTKLQNQEKPKVDRLTKEELTDPKTGKKNGCFKVHCWIKTENGYKEMEAFGQNMYDEIVNNGEDSNGRVNLGYEKQKVEVVETGGTKVNIGSEPMAAELYLKTTPTEFALYNLNGWGHKGALNPKALQRIFNLINLDGQEFEDSIDQMIKDLVKFKPPTDEARIAQESLQHLWEKFKTLETNHRNGEKKGGLVNHLMEVNNIKFNTTDDRENKILSTEKAVDIITQKTKEDMDSMASKFEAYKKNKERPSEELIADIDEQISSLANISKEYKKYLSLVNKDDKNDFCVYAAIPQLRNHFIMPILTELNRDRMELKNKKK